MAEEWVPDILGDGFEQLTLPLGVDGQSGPLDATLVRSIPNHLAAWAKPLADVDVLYIHGWSDYFFQTELAHFHTSRGARFYALDLRRYGRSIRPGQTRGYVGSLDDYDLEIELALEAMGHGVDADPKRKLVLLGHSTGGLTLTLWAARHSGRASALVLNSPWLELQIGAIGRQVVAPLVGMRARVDPRGNNPVVDLGYYTRAQKEVGSLPVPHYREDWRPEFGFPTKPGWLEAVVHGHARIARGIDVGCPALVMLSAHSASPFTWTDSATNADSVLIVDDIAKAATRIGDLVTIARVDGAIHDVFLSRAQPRQKAYKVLDHWLVGLR
ncbi:alpha/beta hydrolase [Microbacterium sp. NPDC076911]|uniref:alpha/beta hydrolase n=1 Tax=Microbacterium sp. NPDC076911 TaxID=3154958 RepID=UPI003414B8C2